MYSKVNKYLTFKIKYQNKIKSFLINCIGRVIVILNINDKNDIQTESNSKQFFYKSLSGDIKDIIRKGLNQKWINIDSNLRKLI